MPLVIYPKQQELIDAMAPGKRNILLASGPMMCGKSVSALIGLMKRAWYLSNRRVCVLSQTQSIGTNSGVWDVLINTIAPQYMENGEMQWVEPPHNEGTTKIPTFSVTNQFGGASKFMHLSLKDEREVEERFKGPEFTDIFMNEASKFHDAKTFRILVNRLRGIGVPEDELMFLADTNPADEGEDSWIYNLFYKLPEKDESEIEPWEKSFREHVRKIEFTIDDNLGLSQSKKEMLFGSLAGDPDLLQRYWYGRWIQASTDAVFANTFRPKYHVLGELETPSNTKPDMLVPEPNCIELDEGWDPGGSANWAMVIGERFHPPIAKHRGRPSFKILDAYQVVGQQIDYIEFVQHVLERRRFWEAVVGRKILWHSYSDRSVLDMKDLTSQKYFVQLIYEASEGEILLEGVDRGPGTLRAGVDLVKMLLFEERLWFNLTYCVKLVEAMKSIRKGKTSNEALEKGSKFKHIIDAMRYLLQHECYEEMQLATVANMRRKHEGNSSLVWTPR